MVNKRQQMEEEVEEEFKDDFADDEFEDEKKSPIVKKPLPKRPQKDEYDEDEEEDKVEFEEEEPKMETRGRPKGTFRKPQPQMIQGQKEQIEEEYSVYHQSERNGIKNSKNESIGEDTLTLLCIILNKLRNLEVGLLGEK